MSDEEQAQVIGELRVDRENLYREEVYTDLRIATLRRLVPVRADGSDDPSRPVLFSGQTTLVSEAGPLPVECPIEASSLEEAVEKFPAALRQAVERLIEEMREIRRREASRIVVPRGPLPGGGTPGGSVPGGGVPGGGILGGPGSL